MACELTWSTEGGVPVVGRCVGPVSVASPTADVNENVSKDDARGVVIYVWCVRFCSPVGPLAAPLLAELDVEVSNLSVVCGQRGSNELALGSHRAHFSPRTFLKAGMMS